MTNTHELGKLSFGLQREPFSSLRNITAINVIWRRDHWNIVTGDIDGNVSEWEFVTSKEQLKLVRIYKKFHRHPIKQICSFGTFDAKERDASIYSKFNSIVLHDINLHANTSYDAIIYSLDESGMVCCWITPQINYQFFDLNYHHYDLMRCSIISMNEVNEGVLLLMNKNIIKLLNLFTLEKLKELNYKELIENSRNLYYRKKVMEKESSSDHQLSDIPYFISFNTLQMTIDNKKYFILLLATSDCFLHFIRFDQFEIIDRRSKQFDWNIKSIILHSNKQYLLLLIFRKHWQVIDINTFSIITSSKDMEDDGLELDDEFYDGTFIELTQIVIYSKKQVLIYQLPANYMNTNYELQCAVSSTSHQVKESLPSSLIGKLETNEKKNIINQYYHFHQRKRSDGYISIIFNVSTSLSNGESEIRFWIFPFNPIPKNRSLNNQRDLVKPICSITAQNIMRTRENSLKIFEELIKFESMLFVSCQWKLVIGMRNGSILILPIFRLLEKLMKNNLKKDELKLFLNENGQCIKNAHNGAISVLCYPYDEYVLNDEKVVDSTNMFEGNVMEYYFEQISIKSNYRSNIDQTYMSRFHANQLISGGKRDFLIKIWDMKKGHLVRKISGHFGMIYSMNLFPAFENGMICSVDDGNIISLIDISLKRSPLFLNYESSLMEITEHSQHFHIHHLHYHLTKLFIFYANDQDEYLKILIIANTNDGMIDRIILNNQEINSIYRFVLYNSLKSKKETNLLDGDVENIFNLFQLNFHSFLPNNSPVFTTNERKRIDTSKFFFRRNKKDENFLWILIFQFQHFPSLLNQTTFSPIQQPSDMVEENIQNFIDYSSFIKSSQNMNKIIQSINEIEWRFGKELKLFSKVLSQILFLPSNLVNYFDDGIFQFSPNSSTSHTLLLIHRLIFIESFQNSHITSRHCDDEKIDENEKFVEIFSSDLSKSNWIFNLFFPSSSKLIDRYDYGELMKKIRMSTVINYRHLKFLPQFKMDENHPTFWKDLQKFNEKNLKFSSNSRSIQLDKFRINLFNHFFREGEYILNLDIISSNIFHYDQLIRSIIDQILTTQISHWTSEDEKILLKLLGSYVGKMTCEWNENIPSDYNHQFEITALVILGQVMSIDIDQLLAIDDDDKKFSIKSICLYLMEVFMGIVWKCRKDLTNSQLRCSVVQLLVGCCDNEKIFNLIDIRQVIFSLICLAAPLNGMNIMNEIELFSEKTLQFQRHILTQFNFDYRSKNFYNSNVVDRLQKLNKLKLEDWPTLIDMLLFNEEKLSIEERRECYFIIQLIFVAFNGISHLFFKHTRSIVTCLISQLKYKLRSKKNNSNHSLPSMEFIEKNLQRNFPHHFSFDQRDFIHNTSLYLRQQIQSLHNYYSLICQIGRSELICLLRHIMNIQPKEVGDVVTEICDIILFCIDVRQLKQLTLSQVFPPIANFPMISHCMTSGQIAVGCVNGTVSFYDANGNKYQLPTEIKHSISACAISPDGKCIALYSEREKSFLVYHILTSISLLGMGGNINLKLYKQMELPQREKKNMKESMIGLVRLYWTSNRCVALYSSDAPELKFQI
ncbi:hypothetical protein SNEBB_009861 [Seison nebaliae]|nr:hypothetical protein SNEBB_009861 [Seison nebaliae]